MKENINSCQYILYPIENISLLPQLLIYNPALSGLNTTIPYKESVIPFLDELDITAQNVGAVNCIKVKTISTNKRVLIGYNTDVFGFRQSIKPFLESHHERALILGTGGGAKAVAYVLKEIGIDYFFVSRNKSKSHNCFSYEELNENIINSFKLILNTTPVGMFPNIHDLPNIPYQYISSSHLLYDLVYNPPETEFLKRGRQQGASTVNGLSMFHQQAEESWRIWNTE